LMYSDIDKPPLLLTPPACADFMCVRAVYRRSEVAVLNISDLDHFFSISVFVGSNLLPLQEKDLRFCCSISITQNPRMRRNDAYTAAGRFHAKIYGIILFCAVLMAPSLGAPLTAACTFVGAWRNSSTEFGYHTGLIMNFFASGIMTGMTSLVTPANATCAVEYIAAYGNITKMSFAAHSLNCFASGNAADCSCSDVPVNYVVPFRFAPDCKSLFIVEQNTTFVYARIAS